MRRWIAGLLLAWLAWSGAAEAHTRSESHSSWTISGPNVQVIYAIPLIELKRLTPNGALPTRQAEATYVAQHLWVTAGALPCRRTADPTPLAADQVFRRTQMGFQCPSAAGVVIHASAFFELVPNHMHFAQVQTSSGQFFEQLFTKDQQSLSLEKAKNPLESAGFGTYVLMGMMHIFTGVDHMSFLLGLVLLSRRVRDLLFVVTGFTLGHSCTLALAVLGVIRPQAQYIDALVALTILLVGAENISVASGRPKTVAFGMVAVLGLSILLKSAGLGGLPIMLLVGAAIFSACYILLSGRLGDAGRLRLMVTVVFGLIHGFGFAAGLLDMELPKARLAQLLVGFNVGVELAQMCVVLAIVGLATGLSRLKLGLPRPAVVDMVAAGLACIGAYWFFGRSFGL